MKTKIMFATIACAVAFQANAQKVKHDDVPANVKKGFAAKYPDAKVEEWEKEGEFYEAEFDLNKVESSALFDVNGGFKELEQEIKTSELPKTATEYCSKTFADYKLEEASKITDAAGKVLFEAEMKKGREKFDLIFDDKGNFVKKSS
jgi:hypothetical protein